MTDTTLDLMARLEAATGRLLAASHRGHPWLTTLALSKVTQAQAELITLASARPTPRSGIRPDRG